MNSLRIYAKDEMERMAFSFNALPEEKRIIETYMTIVRRGHGRGDIVRELILDVAAPAVAKLQSEMREDDIPDEMETIR